MFAMLLSITWVEEGVANDKLCCEMLVDVLRIPSAELFTGKDSHNMNYLLCIPSRSADHWALSTSYHPDCSTSPTLIVDFSLVFL